LCQLLIHTAASNTATDPTIACGQFGPGDVIAVEDDTHVWGALDIGPHNQIVIMPGVSAAQMASLLITEYVAPANLGSPGNIQPLPPPIFTLPLLPRLRVSNVNTHATLPVGGVCQGAVLGNVLTVTQPPSFQIAVNHAVCGLSGGGSASITAFIGGTGGAGTYRLGTVFASAVQSRQLVIGPVAPNAVPATWLQQNTVPNPQVANPNVSQVGAVA
jgi:hypothetical protein